jgi:hypothetical protein
MSTSQAISLPDPLSGIKNTGSSLLDFFFGSDIAFILSLCAILIVFGIGLTVGFEVVLPNIRTQFANNIIAVIGSIIFIIIILRFAKSDTTVSGLPINMGMIIYILAIGFLVIAFSG